MTYNVFGGTLNLAQSQSIVMCAFRSCRKIVTSEAAFYPTSGDKVTLPVMLSSIKWRWWV